MAIVHKTLTLFSGLTATNSPPSSASDGVDLNAIAIAGNVSDSATLLIKSTAGSGTMTVTVKLWGYVADTAIADWFPLGANSDATKKGLVNNASAIDEHATDSLRHAEVLSFPGHFDRIYAEVTAIGGTSTTLSAFLICESSID